VGTLTLESNANKALFSKECLATSKRCLLPNTHDCVKLVVEIYGDGRTIGICHRADGTKLGLKDITNILQCRTNKGAYDVQCIDVNENLVFDATHQDSHVYPGRASASYQRFIGSGGAGLGEGAGFLENDQSTPVNPPPDDVTPPTTPEKPTTPGVATPDTSEMCKAKAKQLFVAAMNSALKAEGFKFAYKPVGVNNSQGFFNQGDYQSNPALVCQQAKKPACEKQAASQGKCYCWDGWFGPSCKGAPLIDSALAATCSQMPAECKAEVFSQAAWDESRGAVTWFNNAQSQIDAQNTAGAVATGIAVAGGLAALASILADPLVLDLEGNGIQLSSPEEGVRFDLTGAGPGQVAWVKGKGNALLALDRDGNGRIDHGGELFSDTFTLRGERASDGFSALALLDRAENGGNADGRVDAGDRLYRELRLWTDANGDGVSQPGELRTLRGAGVKALELRYENTREVKDAHGNDLSCRGQFVLESGRRGVMADAFLLRK
jgi:hypothetical protein